jgi:CBS domain containing-hemolysin-like protein
MVVLFLAVVCSAYFSCMGRIYAVLDQSSLINDLKEEKKRILFSFLKEVVSSDVFFFYITMVLGHILTFSIACILLYQFLYSLVILNFTVSSLSLVLTILVIVGIIYLAVEVFSQILFKIRGIHNFQGFYLLALVFYLVSYPIVQLLFSLQSFLLLNVFKKANTDVNLEYLSGRNLGMLLNAPTTNKTKDKHSQELQILQNALLFSNTRIRDCMIPRTEVEAVDLSTDIDEVRSKFIETGYSKLIVYQENIDNVIGYISSKEIFKRPQNITEKLSQITFVPESMPANRLLHEFMHDNRSIAVVVDEYGGTSGMVTLEDIMEEIFGDIEDEHDTDDLIERRVRNGEFVFSGRLEIEYVNTKYNLRIPESEDYDTLAGFILFHYQNMPKINDVVKIDLFSIKILKVTHTRIDLVLFRIGEK